MSSLRWLLRARGGNSSLQRICERLGEVGKKTPRGTIKIDRNNLGYIFAKNKKKYNEIITKNLVEIDLENRKMNFQTTKMTPLFVTAGVMYKKTCNNNNALENFSMFVENKIIFLSLEKCVADCPFSLFISQNYGCSDN